MRKFISILYKDYLFLTRDFAGLMFMFFMPIVLVMLMTYLQDSTYNTVNETRIPLLLLNNDNDSLGSAIEKSIAEVGIFDVSTSADGIDTLTAESLERLVAKGEFQIGIVVPSGTTRIIRKNIHSNVMHSFDPEYVLKEVEPNNVSIFVDPTVKDSFKATIASSISEYAAKLQTQIVLNEVAASVSQLFPVNIGHIELPQDMINIHERYAQMGDSVVLPNSVQHNVPAWSLFAVFFIVISLANNIIKEREDGSYMRIRTMPCPTWIYIAGKMAVYMCVCLLQITVMILMGIYVLPMLGLPKLELGHSWSALAMVSVSSSVAAIGYGMAIGRMASNSQQASIFGAVSVVILAAIGGVWIPIFIMPHAMQIVSLISPLNWGLSGFYDIFVRDSGFMSVMPECGLLWAFALACMSLSVYFDRKTNI